MHSLTYQRVLASRSAASKQSTVASGSDPEHELGYESDGETKVVPGEAFSGPRADTSPQAEIAIALSFKDVNLFPPRLLLLKRRNNIPTLFASGVRNNVDVHTSRSGSSTL